MTKREVVSLLIKLMIVYAMLQFVPSLLYVIGLMSFIHESPTPGQAALHILVSLIIPLFWIGIFVLILRFNQRIAALIVPNDGDCGTLVSLSFNDIQTLGYNFIGLLLIVQSFPQLIQFISTIRFERNMDALARDITLFRRVLPQLFAFLFQFILGLALFLRARGLANLWEKLQQKTMPMRNTG